MHARWPHIVGGTGFRHVHVFESSAPAASKDQAPRMITETGDFEDPKRHRAYIQK